MERRKTSPGIFKTVVNLADAAVKIVYLVDVGMKLYDHFSKDG
jgi:hypothetical protein